MLLIQRLVAVQRIILFKLLLVSICVLSSQTCTLIVHLHLSRLHVIGNQ